MNTVFYYKGKHRFLIEDEFVYDSDRRHYVALYALSKALGVSQRTLYRRIEGGTLEPLKVGKLVVKSLVRFKINPQTLEIII